MKKKILTICLLLFTLVLVGAICEGDDDKKSKKPKEEDKYEDYTNYENKDWKLAVKYPDNWEKEIFTNEVEMDEDFIVGFKSSKEGDLDTFLETVVILASEAQPQDFDELMELGIDELAKKESTNIINYSKVIVSGYSGYKVRYNYQDGGIQWEYLHYFIDAKSFWYQILYTGQGNGFDIHLEKAKMIIDSLELF